MAVKCDCLSPADMQRMEQQLTVPAGHRPRLVLLGDVRRQCLQLSLIHIYSSIRCFAASCGVILP